MGSHGLFAITASSTLSSDEGSQGRPRGKIGWSREIQEETQKSYLQVFILTYGCFVCVCVCVWVCDSMVGRLFLLLLLLLLLLLGDDQSGAVTVTAFGSRDLGFLIRSDNG